MDLFNKKKVRKLYKNIDSLQFELSSKNTIIKRLETTNSNNQETISLLINENQKLIDWVQKILEVAQICKTNEGLQTVNIPIVEDKHGKYNSNWETPLSEEIIIPSIRFRKINNIAEW